MLTLEWIGKNKVVNHHQKGPFRVLERQYSFDEQGQRYRADRLFDDHGRKCGKNKVLE